MGGSAFGLSKDLKVGLALEGVVKGQKGKVRQCRHMQAGPQSIVCGNPLGRKRF